MSHEWIAWAKEEIISLSKIVRERNAEIALLRDKVKEMEKLCVEMVIQATGARERGASDFIHTLHSSGRCNLTDVELMQLWKEGRK